MQSSDFPDWYLPLIVSLFVLLGVVVAAVLIYIIKYCVGSLKDNRGRRYRERNETPQMNNTTQVQINVNQLNFVNIYKAPHSM